MQPSDKDQTSGQRPASHFVSSRLRSNVYGVSSEPGSEDEDQGPVPHRFSKQPSKRGSSQDGGASRAPETEASVTRVPSGKGGGSVVRFDGLFPHMNTIQKKVFEKKEWRASTVFSKLDDAEAPVPEIPKRHIIRTTKWVGVFLLVVLFGIMGWAGYSISVRLIDRHATWQWVAVGVLPMMFFFFSFALKVVVSTIFLIFFASVRALTLNSEYYSAIPTPMMPGWELPPVIVQVPVYKEDLEEVIKPTYDSVLAAMKNYREMGGSIKMMICDDGLQAPGFKDIDFQKRMKFYLQKNIAFVARPPNNRRGLFKKASNMNYTFKVIDRMAELTANGLSQKEALTRTYEEFNGEFVAGGDLFIPENALILLLDADTKIPPTAISATIPEFIESPELPYTQHFTMPFSEQNRNYWEATISNFTRKIYTIGIGLGTSQGDFAPLVGHNAILRWRAMKSVAWVDKVDNEKKYWSEDHVSEDFDMFMRFAANNKFGRYVVYTGDGFQEGVSLTYIDEIIKLRKFAYGACEMVFNKMYMWPYRGPFSPLIIRFMGSRHIPWYQKVSLLSYLATYFALASGPWLNLLEACLAIWVPEYYDTTRGYAIRGLDVTITCAVVFTGFAPVSEVMVRWRSESLKGGNLLLMVLDNIKWVPTITVLFAGCMFQLATAMLTYFLNLKVVWGATTKETTDLTCYEALRNTWAMFMWQYLVVGPLCGAFVFATYWYKLSIVQAFGPLWFCGFTLSAPILLNPHIMALSF